MYTVTFQWLKKFYQNTHQVIISNLERGFTNILYCISSCLVLAYFLGIIQVLLSKRTCLVFVHDLWYGGHAQW